MSLTHESESNIMEREGYEPAGPVDGEAIAETKHIDEDNETVDSIREVEALVSDDPQINATKVAGTANLENIDAFVNGTKTFDDVIGDYAKLYGDAVNSNVKWSWNGSIHGGNSVPTTRRALIKEKAVLDGLIPRIEVEKVDGHKFGYADFAGAKQVVETLWLPEHMWKQSDYFQLKWLDEQIGGHRPDYSWHHSEVPGKMEQVPYGIHKVTSHNGGKSTGMWADAPR